MWAGYPGTPSFDLDIAARNETILAMYPEVAAIEHLLLLVSAAASADSTTYLLVKLRNPATTPRVRDELQDRGERPSYKL